MASSLPILLAQSEAIPAQELPDLPPLAHAPIALALIAGFLLWVVGGKLIKPAFAAMGIVLGGLGGFLLLPQLGVEQALGMPSPYAGLLFGSLSGLIFAIVVFRMAVGVASAGAFALVGLLSGLAFLQVQPMVERGEQDVEVDEHASALATDGGSLSFLEDLLGENQSTLDHAEEVINNAGRESFESLNEDTQSVMRGAYEQCRAFFDALVTQAGDRWAATSVDERMILMGGTILGAVAGLLIGFAAPKRSSAVVSALAGSAIWLASAVWLMYALEAPGREFLQMTPLVWVIIWLAAAGVGVMLQVRSRRSSVATV